MAGLWRRRRIAFASKPAGAPLLPGNASTARSPPKNGPKAGRAPGPFSAGRRLGPRGDRPEVAGVTYDTGALVAAERNSRRMWALHAGFLAEEVVPVVPAPVLAQAWRGGSRQASLARLLAPCAVEPMTEAQSRDVGVLAGKAGHDDVVDVTVVEGAIRRRQSVVTSNEVHIRKIANAARVELRIERV